MASAALAWKLSFQGRPLTTTAAPDGILSYEFSWSRSGAQTILDSWKGLAPVAREQLILDYPFLVIYPLLLSLACGMLGDSLGNARAFVGAFISWGVLLAGPLDAIENYELLKMVESGASEDMAKVAGWCAGTKFVLIFSALGYIVAAGIMNLFAKG
jgi:hypothetical protein